MKKRSNQRGQAKVGGIILRRKKRSGRAKGKKWQLREGIKIPRALNPQIGPGISISLFPSPSFSTYGRRRGQASVAARQLVPPPLHHAPPAPLSIIHTPPPAPTSRAPLAASSLNLLLLHLPSSCADLLLLCFLHSSCYSFFSP